MKHYTFNELESIKEWEEAVIVFKQESFTKPFSLEERSYKISHKDNWFAGEKISCSLYGYCLDGKDLGVRLDWYMRAIPSDGIGNRWLVDYCYIIK